MFSHNKQLLNQAKSVVVKALAGAGTKAAISGVGSLFKKRKPTKTKTIGRKKKSKGSSLKSDPKANRMEAGTVRGTKVKHSKKKVRPTGGKKKIKVSRKFAQMVKVVNEPNQVYGTYSHIYNQVLGPGLTGRQTVQYIGRAAPPSVVDTGLFGALRVLHAASRLFNGKAANFAPHISDTGYLNIFTSNISVVKQWMTYRVKNNFERTVTMSLMQCISKRASAVAADPIGAWASELTQAQIEGYIIGTPTVNINNLYTSPSILQAWNKEWKFDELMITLEPGQTYEFSVDGPSMEYRMADFYETVPANTFMFSQKQDVHLVARWWFDQVIDSTGLTGARNSEPLAVGTNVAGGNINFEGHYVCRLKLPENVGFVNPAVVTPGATQQMDKRVNVKCFDMFQTIADLSGPHRIDEIKSTGTQNF